MPPVREIEKVHKLKILIFGMTADYGGVESFIMSYFRNMNHKEISFDFIAYNQPPAFQREIEEAGSRIFVIPGRGRKLFSCIRQIKQILRETKYNAVWSNLCYLSDILVLKYAKKAGVPVRIIHAHNNMNMSGAVNGLFHKINRRKIWKTATHFWACSELAGEFFYPDRILKSERYRIVPNAVDTEKFAFNPQVRISVRSKLGLDDKYVIGNVGRLHFQKNQAFLLDVFKCVLSKKSNAFLLIAGEGGLRDMLEAKIRELGIENNVLLLGRRDDVSDLMQAMDVFVLPSLFEGLGIVLIEAQCCGLPCLTSSGVVPKEARVTDLLEYESLDEPAEKWAKHILNIGLKERTHKNKQVRKAGYDIVFQAKQLTNFFLKGIENGNS